jgi:hypothetical protein
MVGSWAATNFRTEPNLVQNQEILQPALVPQPSKGSIRVEPRWAKKTRHPANILLVAEADCAFKA